jgi:putative ATPase
LTTLDALPPKLQAKLKQAEEAIYTNPDDALVNWDLQDLEQDFVQAGWVLQTEMETVETQVLITAAMLDRWFGSQGNSYRDRLSGNLKPQELAVVEKMFRQQLLNQSVTWQTHIAFLRAKIQP